MKSPRTSSGLVLILGTALAVFTLVEVNHPRLSPQSQLAVFAMLGLVLCFLGIPPVPGWRERTIRKVLDAFLAVTAVFCCLYVVVQTEPWFQAWWAVGQSLGGRAGQETALDLLVGTLGLLIVLEATRRAIGWTLPLLAVAFLAYGNFGPILPEWLFPHRGYGLERLVAQTFLQSQGIFGVALRVMFTYVFLFILLGAFLRTTGATRFIVDFARRFFRGSRGGPAKVAVLSSGLMGSLSGSAVANTATTGTFTIPMMRASGFRSHVAAGVEAAASSGGALVPPVMGAGAYMMLEIITPPVTYLQIIQAALLPACLYYLSLFLIVHFFARRLSEKGEPNEEVTLPAEARRILPPSGRAIYEGVLFGAAFTALLAFLISGYTPFRAVTLSLGVILVLSWFRSRTRITPRGLIDALSGASKDVIPLICASACVGIIIGVVVLTGVGARFPSVLLPLAEGNLALALMLIMVSTIILGMGLPSAVCYLLMATLIGPVLGALGIVPLAAHLFIFYFGMMSMVTPPVALAAYAAASIAGSNIMLSSLSAFRFALVGFTLPYMFVFRPELLMLNPEGQAAAPMDVATALLIAVLGVVAFAGGISGFLVRALSRWQRVLIFASAALLLFPGQRFMLGSWSVAVHDVAGALLLAGIIAVNALTRPASVPAAYSATGKGKIEKEEDLGAG